MLNVMTIAGTQADSGVFEWFLPNHLFHRS